MDTTRAISRKDSLASLRRKALPLTLSLLLCGALAGAPADAAVIPSTTTPTGGTIVGGAASIVQDGANVVINQTSNKLVLNWQTFNIGQDASVLFNQPGTSSVALNRILDQNPSQIFGQISSNGQVFLINTHGIIFGASAKVNVGGLVASTLDLTPSDFLSDHFNLNAVGGSAGIVNHGTIAAASGGSVSLIGGSVVNDGVILANYGRINLDGADHAVLDFDGNGLINVQITGELKQRLDAKAAVSNAGTLQAEGGTVVLQAAAARDLFTNLVNNSGVIDAGGISHDGGVVRLVARGGDTVNSGSIDVTGMHGGSAQLLSDGDVTVTGKIDASGTLGGGSIRVGGGARGGEGLLHAATTHIGADAALVADATGSGNGGSIAVWGDRSSEIAGQFSARGGTLGGDGGLVETSAEHVAIADTTRVDTRAPAGNSGEWLIDPRNFDIAASGGDITGAALSSSLATTDVTILSSDGSGPKSASGDINVSDDVSWSAHKLTLTAVNDVNITATMTASGTAALTVSPAGGAINIGSGGKLVLSGSGAMALAGVLNDAGTFDISGLASGITLTSLAGAGHVLLGGNLTLSDASGTFSGDIAGNGGLVLGGGTETLSGTNTYKGGTVLNGGTLKVSSDANLGDAAGGLIFNGGTLFNTAAFSTGRGIKLQGNGTLQTGANLTVSGVISGSGNLGKTGTGKLTLTGVNTYTGGTGISAGTLALSGSGSLAASSGIAADGTFDISGTTAGATIASLTGAGTVSLGSQTLTLSNASGTFSGVMGGSGGLTLAAGQEILSGANTYTGDTVIDAGTLALSGSGSVATSHGVAVDGTLDISGSTSGATIQSLTGTGAVKLGGKALTLANASGSFGGIISGTGSLVLAAGNQTLGGTNTYSGGTTVNGGTLAVSSNANLGAASGALTLDGGTLENTASLALNRTLKLGASGGTLLTDAGTRLTLAGMTSGSGGLTQSGAGSLILAGDVSTGGDQAYNGNVLLGNDVSLTSSNGSVRFSSTVDNADATARALTVNAGNGSISFGGAVGGGANGSLASLATTSKLFGAQALSIAGGLSVTTTAGDIVQGGAFHVGGMSDFAAGSHAITLTAADNQFGGAVSLTGGATQITSNGALTLGAVNASSLTAGATGNAVTLDGDITTSGSQAYDDAVILGADAALASTGGGNIAFASTVDGGHGLGVSTSGGVSFDGAVGSGSRLTRLTVDSGTFGATGTLDIDGDLSVSTTAGDIVQNGIFSVTGASHFDAGGHAINLTQANAFGGAVSLANSGLNDVALTGSGLLTLGDVSVGSGSLSLTGTAGIAQAGGGRIVQAGAGVVTLDAGTGALALASSGNDFVGAVTATGTGVSITDQNDLTVAGLANNDGSVALVAGGNLVLPTASIATSAGDITLAAHGGALVTPGDLSAANISLSGYNGLTLTNNLTASGTVALSSGNGAIVQSAGAISAGVLSGNSLGSTTLLGAGNAITSLGSFSANGFNLLNGLALTVSGTVDGGSSTALASATGDLVINGTVGNAAGSTTLTAAGAIREGAGGVVKANTLTGSSVGATTLTGANQVVALSNFSANGLSLTNAQSLTVGTGALASGGAGGTTLATTSGDLAINGTVGATGATTTLVSAGALTEGAGGSVLASMLSGSAAGDATLGGSNLIGRLGSFSAADFTLVNAQALTIDGPLTTTGNVDISTSGGPLSVAGAGVDAGGDIRLAANASDLSVTAALAGRDIDLTGRDGVSVDGNLNASRNLSLTSTDAAITGSGAFAVAGASTINAGSGAITLTNAGNDFVGAVSLTGGTTRITDKNALTLGSLATGALTAISSGDMDLGNGNIGGPLGATSNGGAISQSGALEVSGNSTIDAGSGAITLANAGNDFIGMVDLTGGATQVTDSNALSLGTLATGALTAISHGTLDLGSGRVNGKLVARSNDGAIGQDGALSVIGSSSLDAGTGAITLGNAGNDFTGAVSLSGGATLITDSNALSLGTLATGALTASSSGALNLGKGSVSGDLLASSHGGAISQATGGLAISGTSGLDGGSAAITLADANNDFGGTVNLTGGTTQITDRNALILGALDTSALTAISTGALNLGSGHVQGNLVADSNDGAIGQSGALAVDGASSLDAGNGVITLADGGNDFIGAVSLTAAATQLTDQNALSLGTLATGALTVSSSGAMDLGSGNVGGALTATSHGGAIGQDGALGIAGAASIDAGTGAIALTDAGNDFQAGVSLTGAGIAVRAANDLAVSAVSAAPNSAISLVAGGTLSLPTSAINTGTAELTLASDGGSLATAAALGGNNITLRGRDGLILGHDVTASGTLQLVSSNGAIAQSAGVLTATTLTGSAAGSALLLQANAIASLGAFNADGFALANAGALDVAGPLNGGTGGVSIDARGVLGLAGDIHGDSISLHGNGMTQSGGVINAGAGQVSLRSDAGITQLAGGAIVAGTLDGNATGDVMLAGANQLGQLGGFTAANLTLHNAQGLTVGGPVNIVGAATLDVDGDLAVNGALTAASTVLNSAGSINEGASGDIATGALSGRAGGDVVLGEANHIAALGDFTADNITLTNAQALAVSGNLGVGNGAIALTTTTGVLSIDAAMNGGDVSLDAGGDLRLAQSLQGDTVTLASGGNISQSAGAITASTLSGHSAGSTTLGQANAIGTLAAFSAHGFTLVNGQGLSVSGPLDGAASTRLDVAGELAINGVVRGDSTTLIATGAIGEGAGGSIVASTLNGQAGGAATLDGANRIDTLGDFQATGFSLHDAGDLRLGGTVDGGASAQLATTGNLALDGTLKGATVQLGVGGALSQSAGASIVANTLGGHVAGAADFGGSNAIVQLGDLDAASLSLSNGQALTVSGTVDGGSATALTTTAGDLTINGQVRGDNTVFTAAGSIGEGAQGSIVAATLGGAAGGNVSLLGHNHVGALGGFTAVDFALSDDQALRVNGPLLASGGTIALTTTSGALSVDTGLSGSHIALASAGDLALSHDIHGDALSLQSGGRIQQVGGVISVGTLSGRSVGSTSLDQANVIAALGDFSASGFSLTSASSLNVNGAVDGGASTALEVGGNLTINGALSGDSTKLAATGTIGEGGSGSIRASTLTGQSGGATTLTGANHVDSLGAFTANGLAFTNGKALTLAGPVDGGASVNLTTTAGDLAINGKLSGKTTTLVSAGGIVEGMGGSIKADTLSGRAGGPTRLGTASSPLANYIGTLGNFSSPAGFSLTNAQTLTLASVGGSAYTVDAGNASVYLAVTGGDLLQIGTTPLFDGLGTFASSGRIGTQAAPIYVTGNGPQTVAMIGMPPAYFYAVDRGGHLLPLAGGSSVNVPTSLFTNRAQNANNHTDTYIDPSVISANYRSFGIVPSGILLPADQQACDPEREECDE